MKSFLLIAVGLFLFSCASDSEYYPVLQKSEYLKEKGKPSLHKMSLKKGRPYKNKVCRGQVLFFNNAHTETERALKNQITYACPNTEYLIEAEIKKLWWTTIFYSRSCVNIKAYCPYVRP